MVQSENTWKCQKKCFVFHLFTVSFTSMRSSLSHPLRSGCSTPVCQSAIRWQHCCISNNNKLNSRARVCVRIFAAKMKMTSARKYFEKQLVFFPWKIHAISSFNNRLFELTLLSNRPKSISMRFSSYMKLAAERSVHFGLSKKSLANSWRDYSFMLYAYTDTRQSHTCTHVRMCI